MVEATVRFDLGAESVTVHLPVDLPSGNEISGDISGVLGDAHIVGDLNLIGNVYSEGLLTGIDTFHVQGNGFVWFFQNGGLADLHGTFKAAWGPWGTDTTGWVVGDRVAVAPTAAGKTVALAELVWSGSWPARPVDAPDVTLNGVIYKPEVVNLSQSIVFENLGRGFHIHDSGGIQLLSDVKFLNCGTADVLGNYPHHFHMVGDNARGSLLERVVVEGGKNHAFVPHASHGITYRDCAAYKTTDSAYWWDPPGSPGDMTDLNNSHDVVWDHCLALIVAPFDPSDVRVTAFAIGEGVGNVCVNCVAVGVAGGKNSSGFRWQQNSVWQFDNCLAHNNRRNGIFSWTQSPEDHLIENFDAYHNRRSGIEHGSYINSFTYRNCLLHTGIKVATGSDATAGIMQFALSRGDGLLFEDIITDDRLTVGEHGIATVQPVIHRRCSYSNVVYQEGSVKQASTIRFEDCGLVPAEFTFTTVRPASVTELYEGGTLTHRAVGGVWQ